MTKCSKCGGRIITSMHCVYRYDGGSSGTHHCPNCGATKSWIIEGKLTETTIDMS